MTSFTGGCHCGQLSYQLEWPEQDGILPARRCGCSYCTRFNGTWTSHPDARLVVRDGAEKPASRYRFGTSTADWLACSHCGITVLALCEHAGKLLAVVNVNTLHPDQAIRFEHSDSNFDSENTDQRLERRLAKWTADVTIERV